jgi:hypothetical protein
MTPTKKYQTDKKRIDWLATLTVDQKNEILKLSNAKKPKFWKNPQKAFRNLVDEAMSKYA